MITSKPRWLVRVLAFAAFVAFGSAPGRCAPAATGATNAPVVYLWPNGAPGSEAKKDVPETNVKGRVASVHNPSLTVFLPAAGAGNGSAVVILPGGGHQFLTMESEGYAVGRRLAAHGIAGFVLKYRLAREPGSTYKVEVEALQDTQRAVRVVRSRAAQWGVDPMHVGVMGFSAGGELAAMVSSHNDGGQPEAADSVERESCKPAFQALIYPGGTSQMAPNRDSPPAFLACGYDDRPDISSGLAQIYLKFKQAGVPAELHIFTGVGHGFGAKPGPASSWPDRFADWLARTNKAAPAPVH